MDFLVAENVNGAYVQGLELLKNYGDKEQSRAGEVIVSPFPVTTMYLFPWQCVLFDEQRDANPFFHLAEAFWMLGGMKNAKFLDHFISDFSERFAERDGNMHGAYGHRWRCHWLRDGLYLDQVASVIDLLKRDPTSRRAVIQMWDPVVDLGLNKKDHPCNISIAFRCNQDAILDMTVFCRSNDAIWGAYGANAVHFSFLQQYIAGAIQAAIGYYWQISNNYHAYTSVFNKCVAKLDCRNLYADGQVRAYPLYGLAEESCSLYDLNIDITNFLNSYSTRANSYRTPFFRMVLGPMFEAYKRWKETPNDRQAVLSWSMRNLDVRIDWHRASYEWMCRRVPRVK
jgi:hypothetical protein